jgi:hypothetical protein
MNHNWWKDNFLRYAPEIKEERDFLETSTTNGRKGFSCSIHHNS